MLLETYLLPWLDKFFQHLVHTYAELIDGLKIMNGRYNARDVSDHLDQAIISLAMAKLNGELEDGELVDFDEQLQLFDTLLHDKEFGQVLSYRQKQRQQLMRFKPLLFNVIKED